MKCRSTVCALFLIIIWYEFSYAYPAGKSLWDFRPLHYIEVSGEFAHHYDPSRRNVSCPAILVYEGQSFKDVLSKKCHEKSHKMPLWLCSGSSDDIARVSNLEMASKESIERHNVVAAFQVILYPSVPDEGVPLVVHAGDTTKDIVRKGLDICDRFHCPRANVEALLSMIEALLGNSEEPRIKYALPGVKGWTCDNVVVRVSWSGEDLLSTVMAAAVASECTESSLDELVPVEGTTTMDIKWSVLEYADIVYRIKGAMDTLPINGWKQCPSQPEGNGIEVDVCVWSKIHSTYMRIPSLDLGFIGAEEWFHDSWALLVAENIVYRSAVPRKRNFAMKCNHEKGRFHSYGSVLDRSTIGMHPLFLMGVLPELPDDQPRVRADLSSQTGMSIGVRDWNFRLDGHKSLAQDEFGNTWNVVIEGGCYLSEHIPAFRDTRVDTSGGYIYKAIVKIRARKDDSRCRHLAPVQDSQGLHAVGSFDGLDWHLLKEEPVILPSHQMSFRWFDHVHSNNSDAAAAVFDSPACTMYDEFHKVYRIFARLNPRKSARHVQTASSKDFLNWSMLRPVSVRGLDGIQLFPYIHYTPREGPLSMSYDPTARHPKPLGLGIESFYFTSVFPASSNPKILLGAWSRCFRVGMTCDVVLVFSRDGGLSWTRAGDNGDDSRQDLSAWIRGNPTVLEDVSVGNHFAGEFDYRVLPIMGAALSPDNGTDIFVMDSPLHRNATVMRYTVDHGIFGWIENEHMEDESTIITRTFSIDRRACIYAQIAVVLGLRSPRISAALLTHEGFVVSGFSLDLSSIAFSKSSMKWQLVPLIWSNQQSSADIGNFESSGSRTILRVQLVFSNIRLSRLVLR